MVRMALIAEPDWFGRARFNTHVDGIEYIVTPSKFARSALRGQTSGVTCIRPVHASVVDVPCEKTKYLYPGGGLSGEKVHRAYSAIDAFVEEKCADRLLRAHAACAFIALTGFEKTLDPVQAVFVPQRSPSCATRFVTELTERTAAAFGITVVRL